MQTYETMVIYRTSLSPYLLATYPHKRVAGNATNWTSIKAWIIELVSKPKLSAKVDANYITVWAPSMNKKNAIKNKKAFLY